MYNRLFRIFPERIVKLTFFREIKYAARTYCKVRGGPQRGHSLHLGPLDPRPLHAEAGGQLGGVRQLLRYNPQRELIGSLHNPHYFTSGPRWQRLRN